MNGHANGGVANGTGCPEYPLFRKGEDSVKAYFERLFRERIVIYDGAMGTMIQKYKLSEEQYRVGRVWLHVCALFLCPFVGQQRENNDEKRYSDHALTLLYDYDY